MAKRSMTYAQSGVDIASGDAMVGMIRHHLQRTHDVRVISKHGGFAGAFRLDWPDRLFARDYKDPVLVACTDGVGSKVKLAAQLNKYHTVGQDLVAMSVNDLVVQGAEPLFFLDYIATHVLEPAKMTELVASVADGCQLAGCALLGGETAEMPDIYAKGDFDLAGFAVGVTEARRLIDGSRIMPGDIVLGLASSGIHSNGYSLVRAIVREAKLKLDKPHPDLPDDPTLGDALLRPTRIYSKHIAAVLKHYKVKRIITGMAHITGGGLADNLARTLPDKCDAKIDTKTWNVPPLFTVLQQAGDVEAGEMWRVFNMGIGYCVVVREAFADSVQMQLQDMGETVYRIGKITKGSGQVRI